MIQDKKILCVLNTFFNYEHIKECFDSLYTDKVDFFILENKSKYSNLIESYFEDKNVIGYLQAEDNVTHGTVDYFLKNYLDLIQEYDYLTITDGDLLVDNIDSLYSEIISILDENRVLVCCVDLLSVNLPVDFLPEAINWIPKSTIINNKFLHGFSGTHMLTIKKENIQLLTSINKFIDVEVQKNVTLNNGLWAKTLLNKAKHLTWDYDYEGNEYYDWKKNNQWTIGIHNKVTKFNKIR